MAIEGHMGTGGRQDGGTATQVLDVAERLVQRRGFNGFSYADVSAELGITKAALHYHFASKGELGEALLRRYTARFMSALAALDAGLDDGRAKIAGYIDLYSGVLRDDRMCLCGMLAAEYQTLPPPMQEAVTAFLDENEAWLAGVLEGGRRDGTFSFSGDARGRARAIVAVLEGAMLVTRPYRDPRRFEAAVAHLLDDLGPGASTG